MNKKILAAYEALADGYHAKIDHKPHNAYYDRPNTLALLPPLAGKHVLDAACGPGKYAEIMLAQGAEVTGVDLSPKMIEWAKVRNPDRGTFFVHDLSTPFTTLAEATFDIVLCALALHYLEDWGPTIREFHRVLRPGGQLVISIEHPFFEYNYHQSEHYFAVEAVEAKFGGFGPPVMVPSHRRPLEACIAPLTENGFYLDRLVEPKPTEDFARADPRHYRELNAFPAFLCLRAVRRP